MTNQERDELNNMLCEQVKRCTAMFISWKAVAAVSVSVIVSVATITAGTVMYYRDRTEQYVQTAEEVKYLGIELGKMAEMLRGVTKELSDQEKLSIRESEQLRAEIRYLRAVLK